MVISWMLRAKSWAWAMAVSRLTRVSHAIMPPQASRSISQIAPVRRREMGVSASFRIRGSFAPAERANKNKPDYLRPEESAP